MATDPRTKKLLRELGTIDTLVKQGKFKAAQNAVAFSERGFDSVFRALPQEDKSKIAGRILDVKQSIQDGKAADLGKEQTRIDRAKVGVALAQEAERLGINPFPKGIKALDIAAGDVGAIARLRDRVQAAKLGNVKPRRKTIGSRRGL